MLSVAASSFHCASTNPKWSCWLGGKLDAKVRLIASMGRFVEQQMEQDNGNQEAASSKGSVVTSASRDSLYRHFDKLTKEEQIAVLKDALGRKDRLDKLESASEKFDDAALSGLSSQAKAEMLIKVSLALAANFFSKVGMQA